MTISAGVGAAEATSTGLTAVATLNGTTAGRSLALFAEWDVTSATIVSITVNGESDMTVRGSPTINSSLIIAGQCATLDNITTGGNKTITVTWSASQATGATIWVREYQGTNTGGVFDATNGATGTSGTPSLNLTTIASNAHIIAMLVGGNDITSPGAGYTSLGMLDDDWFNSAIELTSFDAGVPGVKTVNATMPSNQWLLVAVSLKPAVVAAISGPTGANLYFVMP